MASRRIRSGQLTVSQLHPPRRTLGEHNHDLTIIFFCGSTWTNTWIQRRHPEVCWPRDWLPKAVEKWGLTRGMLVLSLSHFPHISHFCQTEEIIADQLVEILLERCHALLWLPVICFLVAWLESIVLILPLIISAWHLGLCFNHNCVLRFPHHTLQ
jgi:hypothetical protein